MGIEGGFLNPQTEKSEQQENNEVIPPEGEESEMQDRLIASIAEFERLNPEETLDRLKEVLGDGGESNEAGLKLVNGWRYSPHTKVGVELRRMVKDGSLTTQEEVDKYLGDVFLEIIKKENRVVQEMKEKFLSDKMKEEHLPTIRNFLTKFGIDFPEDRLKRTMVRITTSSAATLTQEEYGMAQHFPGSWAFPRENMILLKFDESGDTEESLSSDCLHELLHQSSIEPGSELGLKNGLVVDGKNNTPLNEAAITTWQNLILKSKDVETTPMYRQEREVLDKLLKKIPIDTFVRATFSVEGFKALEQEMEKEFGPDSLTKLSRRMYEEMREKHLSRSKKPIPLLEDIGKGVV